MPAPASTGKPTHDELSLAELIRLVLSRRWLLLGGMLLGGLAGIAFVAVVPPVYVAKALVLIEPDANARSGTTVASASQTLDSAAVDSQVKILSSRSLAGEVIRALGLETDAELVGAPAQTDKTPVAVLPLLPGKEPVRAAGAAAPPSADPVARFLDRLSVQRDGKSHVIAVTYSSGDGAKAARIANKVAELYMAGQLIRKQEAARRLAGRLDEQLAALKGQLDGAEATLSSFREEAENTRGVYGVRAEEIAELNRQLVAVNVERTAKESRLGRLREQAATADAQATFADLGGAAVLDRLNAARADLLRREAELAAQYGDRHPRIVDIRAEKVQLDARIRQERQILLRQFETEIDSARTRERTLALKLEELKGAALRQEATDQRMQELSREVELNRRLYETYLARASASGAHDEITEPDARVISEAVAPLSASFPKPKLVVSLSLTGGLLFGLCAMFMAEVRERGLDSAGAVETFLGVPAIALVPRLDPARREGIAPQDHVAERPRSRYTEAIREVLAALLMRRGDAADAQVVLVTSSVPDEGKSTLSLSLARVAAAEGLRVLLIDADLRRPSLHELVGLRQGPGLTEVLRREVALSEVLANDPRGTLKLLPGSQRLSQPTKLLGAEGLGALLAAVRRSFDLVILDSAPLVPVADAKLLARLADQILFVVRYRRTDRDFCRLSLQGLTEGGARVTGVVLTQVDLRRHARSGASDAGFVYAKLRQYYAD